MGWMFKKHIPVDIKLIPDLAQNKLLQFQNKYYAALATLFSLIVFLVLGVLFNDFIGAFVAGFGLRVFVLNNCTFFINSLAHTWGSKSYARELSAVDNFIMAFLTFGEGYHNYHHAFPSDYRNGIRWYHFDPTKWLISVLNKLGLANDLRQMDQSLIHRKIILEDKKMFLEVLKERMNDHREELESKVNSLSDRLCAKFSELKIRHDALKLAKMNVMKEDIRKIKSSINELKKSIRDDWNSWMELSNQVTKGLSKGHTH